MRCRWLPGMQCAVHEPSPQDVVRDTPRLLHRMHPHMRQEFFRRLREEFCIDCGQENHRGRECPHSKGA